MAESLAADTAQPVRLLYGVTAVSDLCKLDELEDLRRRVPGLDVHVIVARPDESWDGKVGVVTDLLDEEMSRQAMPMSTCAVRRPWSKPPEPGWRTTIAIVSACTTRSSFRVVLRAGGNRIGWTTPTSTWPTSASAAAGPRW